MSATAGLSGSYAGADVRFLLTPLPLADFVDVADKERLIQSGQRHYSEMLTPERAPSARYTALFDQACRDNGERMARDCLHLAGLIAARLNNTSASSANAAPDELAHAGPAVGQAAALERIADVPIYATDSLVRRATSLQLTVDGRPPVASLPTALWSRLGLSDGARVRVSQDGASALLPARLDATLADTVVRVPAGHPDTAALGAMFGAIAVEKA